MRGTPGRCPRRRREFLLGATFALVLVACTGGGRPKLPPPVYEQPRLPAWEPKESPEEDPLDDALSGGEWVADESDNLGEVPPDSQPDPRSQPKDPTSKPDDSLTEPDQSPNEPQESPTEPQD